MWPSVAAVGIGAALGALLRWQLGERLNRLFPDIPPGTLAANIIGGYIVGLALAALAQREDLPAEWRLLIITGFCGGAHHLLHVLGRNRRPDATRPLRHGRERHRAACRKLDRRHVRRTRNVAVVARRLNAMGPSSAQ